MKEEFTLKQLSSQDKVPVIDIFNYYIENSFAAYLENKVPYDFFELILNSIKGYPGVTLNTKEGEVIGFGFLRSYNPMPAFSKTAEITYFIKAEYVGKGLGKLLLNHLLAEAKKINLDCILASISSLNEISLEFHLRNGFKECGRFLRIGKKNTRDFDVVWMQKLL